VRRRARESTRAGSRCSVGRADQMWAVSTPESIRVDPSPDTLRRICGADGFARGRHEDVTGTSRRRHGDVTRTPGPPIACCNNATCSATGLQQHNRAATAQQGCNNATGLQQRNRAATAQQGCATGLQQHNRAATAQQGCNSATGLQQRNRAATTQQGCNSATGLQQYNRAAITLREAPQDARPPTNVRVF
jgi:hypothetical protein